MNDEQQAQQLARWLDASGSRSVPEGVDAEVLEAVYALRPDLAPRPAVTADDILAGITSGPFAEAPPSTGGEVVPFPVSPAMPMDPVLIDGEDSADDNVVRPWWRGRSMGGVAGLAAAAAALLMVTSTEPMPTANEAAPALAQQEAAPEMRDRKDLKVDKLRKAEAAPPTQPRNPQKVARQEGWAPDLASTRRPPPSAQAKTAPAPKGSSADVIGGSYAGAPGSVEEKARSIAEVPPSDEASAIDDAVVGLDRELTQTASNFDLEEESEPQGRYQNTFLEEPAVDGAAETPARITLQQPTDGLLNSGDAVAALEDEADEDDLNMAEEAAAAEPAPEPPVEYDEVQRSSSASQTAPAATPSYADESTQGARGARPRRAKKAKESRAGAEESPPPAPSAPVLTGAADAPDVLATAASIATGDPAAAARSLEPHIVPPVREGQRAATAAANYALLAGDRTYALRLVERGLALSSASSTERSALLALRQQLTEAAKQ